MIENESNSIGKTESLCPVCMRRIAGCRVEQDGHVYLVKDCPEHGRFRAIIWRAAGEHYVNWGKLSEPAVGPLMRITNTGKGCPFDCGLCQNHKANACTMVMEVTHRCNLHCRVCFAGKGQAGWREPALGTIRNMYHLVLEVTGNPAIQLSGGEPTVRDDLPEIISMGRTMSFEHILVNTNGIRIAKEPGYLQRLVDSGAGTIYLQFDGIDDEVYRYTRGLGLLQVKMDALQNCREHGIGVVLVVTLTPHVNEHQMGDIVRLAKKWIPVVRGIHFQPISYIGRNPVRPQDEDRITIPDVISGLTKQTEGELKEEDFLPRRSQDGRCAFSSLYVYDGHELIPVSRKISEIGIEGWSGLRYAPWELARSFMKIHWQLPGELPHKAQICPCSSSKTRFYGNGGLLWDEAYAQIVSSGLSITCMPFQDIWTLDLERLQGCCGHVVTPDLFVVPFCAYYMTNMAGERLYTRCAI